MIRAARALVAFAALCAATLLVWTHLTDGSYSALVITALAVPLFVLCAFRAALFGWRAGIVLLEVQRPRERR